MLGQDNPNCLQPLSSYPQDRALCEAKERAALRWQHQQHQISISQTEQLKVEVDCIESFFAFATYLDKVNPICTPESIDTVDKLLNTLVQR